MKLIIITNLMVLDCGRILYRGVIKPKTAIGQRYSSGFDVTGLE